MTTSFFITLKNRLLGFYALLPVFIIFHCSSLLADTGQTLPPPVFSHTSGFYSDPFGLLLATSVSGAEIYYTLDGSEPDPDNLNGSTFRYKNEWAHLANSSFGPFLYCTYKTKAYSSFIAIDDRQNDSDRVTNKASSFHNPPYYFPEQPVFKGTVVRSITAKSGYNSSPVVTHTYFISDRSRYNLPIIAITAPEKHLFDYDTGINTPGAIFKEWRENNPDVRAVGSSNANYRQRGIDWERPANFTFWDEGAVVPALNQDIGIRIHGGASRARPAKSLRLYARSQYGKSTLAFPFFPEEDYEEYKRLILRNSGNDFRNTMFRDALIQRVCRELNFDTQAYRPAIIFLNGEYWGILNIRERYDKHYINRVYGVDKEEIDLLTWRWAVKEGDNIHYQETLSYIEEHGLHDDQHYEYIQTRIDTENFIDYQIANIYSANTDWPGNNIDFWRKRADYQSDTAHGHDGRWRWMAFDMDFGFGINGRPPGQNVIEFATMAGGTGWPNPDWSTFLLRSFLENERFRADFVNRFAGLINTSFKPERIVALIDEFQQAIEPDFPDHIARWKEPYSMAVWNNTEVSTMRNYVINRPGHQWGHLMEYFDLDTVSVTLDVSSSQQGYIRINDIDIAPSTPGVSEDSYPWTGTYFSDVPVTLEAVPLKGYRFSHWEGAGHAGTTSFTANPSEVTTITAHFKSAPNKDIIHLWHFSDLPDDDSIQVAATDYSAGEPGTITYPGEGAGYMDRVTDGTEINLQQGTEPLYALRVRNPSDTRAMVFSVPSSGFENLELSFATRRTPNGAWNQTIHVSANGGESWNQVGETYVVGENWQSISADLSEFTLLNDNPDMKIKILFGGEPASGESGNNRFDNITLSGEFLYERTSYYNKPGAPLNETTSWGSEPDGSGQSPDSFEEPGVMYFIQNGDELSISGNWAVSGMLSQVVLGDGSEPVTFTIPSGFSLAGNMDIENKATLVLQSTAIPELGMVSPLSMVVFEQDEMVIVPARVWGSLHLSGTEKVLSGNYLVKGSFTAEDTGLSFAGPTSLTLKGDMSYLGNVTTQYPENVNILATETGNQLFMAEEGNRIEAWNFYIEKTGGSFTMASNIYAKNNLRLDIFDQASFSDNGHILQLGDDLRVRGDKNNFDLSGTVLLAASGGTNDMEIIGVPLNNLVIDVEGDARVDFNDAAPEIVINNDLTIRSRSSRPVRLRDKRFSIKGNLMLDVEEPEQIEQGGSFLFFSGEDLQILENIGYGGPGLLHNIVINGGGLQLEGSITADFSIGFLKGIVYTDQESILRLGPGGSIQQYSADSYVNGPMGIYNDSRETDLLEFPVGKENGLHRVIFETEHVNDNLRLYTAEYFNQDPPQHTLGEGISELLETHGWYSIVSDREGEISTASISLSHSGDDYPIESITIALEKEGEWINIGSEPLPGQQGMIRSTTNLNVPGIFSLALKDEPPVSTRLIGRNLNVYPNPVPENGTIHLPEIMDVTMVSYSGITVLSAENVITLSLEGLPPGVYVLKNRQGWKTRIVIAGTR